MSKIIRFTVWISVQFMFYWRPPLLFARIAFIYLFFIIPVWHHDTAVYFLNYRRWPSHACVALTGGTLTGFPFHVVLQWKHSRDEMRKLKKELVLGVFGKYNMCACNANFHSGLEVCLKCDVFIGLAEKTQASAAVQPGERTSLCCSKESCCFFYGGVDSFNRLIHLVLSQQRPGGTDHFLQLNLINNPLYPKLFTKLWT